MKTSGPPGLGGSIALIVLAMGAVFCGMDAILSDSVTTPAKFGGDYRVHGTDTILVGVGWILMGVSITAKVVLARLGWNAVGSVVAIMFAIIGLLFWLAAI